MRGCGSRGQLGDRAGYGGEVLDPRRAAGLQDLGADGRAVQRPAGAGLERMWMLAPDTEDGCRRVALVAPQGDHRQADHATDLPGDRREHLGRRAPAGHQRRDPPQRALALPQLRVVLAQDFFCAQAVFDVREGDDGAAAGRHPDRSRDVGDRDH